MAWGRRFAVSAAAMLALSVLVYGAFSPTSRSQDVWTACLVALVALLTRLCKETRGITLRLDRAAIAALLMIAGRGVTTYLGGSLATKLIFCNTLSIIFLVSSLEPCGDEGFQVRFSLPAFGVGILITAGVYAACIALRSIPFESETIFCGTGMAFIPETEPDRAVRHTAITLAPAVMGLLVTFPKARLRDRVVAFAVCLACSAAYVLLYRYPLSRGLFFGRPIPLTSAMWFNDWSLWLAVWLLLALTFASLRHLLLNGWDGSGERSTWTLWPRRQTKKDDVPDV